MYSIQVNINGSSHRKNIPQEWKELKWIDYVNALIAEKQFDGNVNKVLEQLTGIPSEALENLQSYDQRFILTQCSFFWNEQPMKSALPTDFVEKQIASDTWQKLIDSEQEFKRVAKSELPDIAAAQMIVKTYTGVDIKGMNVPDALAYWDFFFSNLLSGRSDGRICITQKQMTTRLQQGLKKYRHLSGLPHSTHLRKETLQSSIPFLKRKRMSFTPPYYLRKLKTSMHRTCRDTMNL